MGERQGYVLAAETMLKRLMWFVEEEGSIRIKSYTAGCAKGDTAAVVGI